MKYPTQAHSLPRILVLALLIPIAVACSDKKDTAKFNELTKQANGSPVSAEFVEFTGTGEDRASKVHLQNFGDKKAAGYSIKFRFLDEGGKAITLKKGTPFEKDFTFTGLSGLKYAVDAKSHAVIEVSGMEAPPADAVKAEFIITRVSTTDGTNIQDWWSAEGHFSEWPES